MKKYMKETTIEQPTFSNEELADILIELSDSKYWPAIQAYYNGLRALAEQTLFSTDPFKNPTVMAQNQGFRSALDYLSTYIQTEKNKREKAESEEIKKTKQKK